LHFSDHFLIKALSSTYWFLSVFCLLTPIEASIFYRSRWLGGSQRKLAVITLPCVLLLASFSIYWCFYCSSVSSGYLFGIYGIGGVINFDNLIHNLCGWIIWSRTRFRLLLYVQLLKGKMKINMGMPITRLVDIIIPWYGDYHPSSGVPVLVECKHWAWIDEWSVEPASKYREFCFDSVNEKQYS
jgi:hypothetical protein